MYQVTFDSLSLIKGLTGMLGGKLRGRDRELRTCEKSGGDRSSGDHDAGNSDG